MCFTALEWGFALGKHELVSMKNIRSGPSAVMILISNGSDPKCASLF